MGEICLILSRWDVRTGHTGHYMGGMEGKALVGAGLGALTLAIEVQQVARSDV